MKCLSIIELVRILREKALLGPGQEMHEMSLGNIVEYKEWKQQKDYGVHLKGTGNSLKVLLLQ